MKIVIILTGLVLIGGIYILNNLSGGSLSCAANIVVTHQEQSFLTATLDQATCPDYEDIAVRISDKKGNFLFDHVSQMRITVTEDNEAKKKWGILTLKNSGDAVNRGSFPDPLIEIIPAQK